MKKNIIIIEVKGGTVQEVYGTAGEYIVVDHDVQSPHWPDLFWSGADITPGIPERFKAIVEKVNDGDHQV